MHRDDGFTLVELLLVMAVGGVILALLGSTFIFGYRNAARTSNTFDMNTAGYTVLREITAGFHFDGERQPGLVGAYGIGPGEVYDRLYYATSPDQLEDVSDYKIQYVLGTDGVLTRKATGPAHQVLHDVKDFEVCFDGSAVRIRIVQENSRVPKSSTSLETKVYPRNASKENITLKECE